MRRSTFPWWSEELTALKRQVTTRRRRIGCAAPSRRASVVAEYLEAKANYELSAKKAQIDSWKRFCQKQDGEGVWEGIYRVIGRTTKREEDLPLVDNGVFLDPARSVALLAETFYPGDLELTDNSDHMATRVNAKRVNEWSHGELHDPPFTAQELRAAVGRFNPKKAPGSDGFTADICRQAICLDPEMFLALVNKCLELGYFPKRWKEATVVALRKPGKKHYTSAKSYRPIGLLPVLGKVLERLVVTRLQWHLTPRLSTCQYGFMPQRGTEDSLYTLVNHIREKVSEKKIVAVVSLDIEGAFDNAWWPAIRVRLAEEKCPVNIRRLLDSYLEDRRVNVRYAGMEHSRATSKGCIQGSIGGPILWNTLLDPLLKDLQGKGVHCQAFADDIVVVFDDDTALGIQQQANPTLDYVQNWGVRNKLKFAPHKTAAIVVTRKLKYDTPLLSMGGVDIGISREVKILGLIIDDKLTFNRHVATICNKALGLYKRLSRAAKVSWGLHPEVIRTIYTATIEPIIMYAASAWSPATGKRGVQKVLNAVQRGFAQKLCKSYRTVSLNSALLLSGILPLDLRIQEAAALFKARRGSSRTVLGDLEIERVVGFAETPHPALRVNLEFEILDNQDQVDGQNKQEVRFFTDGSKLEGKVGAAISVWNTEAETKTLKLCLAKYCTVYQAELLAICRATSETLKRKENSFGIYSDSRSALQAVTNHGALHPLAARSRKNLHEALAQGKSVSLFWVKAHAGLAGNERADQLAREAALTCRRRPDYDLCPVSFVKQQVRNESVGEWDRRYRAGGTASVTKMFFPDAIVAYRLVRQIEPTGVLTQIFTGHGGFSQYLNRFKCKESPSCICDPEAVETVPHVLLDCPVHLKQRFEVEAALSTKLSVENLHSVLADKHSRGLLLKYFEIVGNGVIRRNK